MKHLIAWLLAALMLLTLIGCANDAKPGEPEQSQTPSVNTQTGAPETATPAPSDAPEDTAFTGREITLEEPAQRIVALTAADCEIIYAIGAGSTIVGRGAYCNYPLEVNDIPAVESGNETNIEQIMALQPQVVVMNTMAQTNEHVSKLEAAGIKVVVSEATNIAGVYTAIELLGSVVGYDDEAASLIESMKSSLDQIASDPPGDGTKTVYFEVSPLEWGLWTAGSGTFMNEIARMLGLQNAFSDVEGWGEVSQEQVIARNPDYIVTVAMYYGEGPLPVDEIMGRSGWQNMTAITNKTVFNGDSDSFARPGPRLVDAAHALNDFVSSHK